MVGEPEQPAPSPLSEREVVESIRKKLKHYAATPTAKAWLVTPQPLLHEVFGAGTRGIPYGKVIEVSGMESGGKSGLVMELAGLAMAKGASVAWVDLECAWDDEWAVKRGLDPDKVALFQPEVLEEASKEGDAEETIKVGSKVLRLTAAEEIFEELETWVRMKLLANREARIFVAVDSVSAISPRKEVDSGLEKEGYAVQARFISKMLRRWVPLARTHNVILVLINQIRTDPGVMFGNPEYTTGGKALRFYSSIRIRVKRQKGWMTVGGKRVGIRGVLQNLKNKTGGLEGAEVGYRLYFANKRAQFVKAAEVKEKKEEI